MSIETTAMQRPQGLATFDPCSSQDVLLELPPLSDVVAHHARRRVFRTRRRCLDIATALVVSILAFPLLLLIAVAVRIDSPGPLLFGHERLGKNGKLFRCWKFRSMHFDANDRLGQLLASDLKFRAEWLRDQKISNDPRVTRLGKVLRRLSLDELPQLYNVLIGQMSIIGPRPITEEEIPRYGDALPIVLTMKPGMTGLWQVSGRNELPYERRVQLDIEFVTCANHQLDIIILCKTVRTLLQPTNDN